MSKLPASYLPKTPKKTCTGPCGESLPATTGPGGNFYETKKGSGILRAFCKKCFVAHRNSTRPTGSADEVPVAPGPKVKTHEDTSTEQKKLTDDMAEAIEKVAGDQGIDPRDMTWHDFREGMQIMWGKAGGPFAELFTKRHLSRVGGFYSLRDAYFGGTSTAPSQSSVERRRIRALASEGRRIENEGARSRAMFDELKEAAGCFPVLPVPKGIKATPKEPQERVVNVVLSDLHFGSRLMAAEGTHSYGVHEEARRFARVIQSTADYKRDHRKESRLRVFLIGDTFQNKLHDPQEPSAPNTEQMCETVWLLEQGLTRLAMEYQSVEVCCATGNHGRNLARHLGRATSQKWDSPETFVYFTLHHALSKFPNVTFNIPLTPWVISDGPGGKVFATHGDTVFNVGNPHSNLPIKAIEQKVDQLNSSGVPPKHPGPFAAFVLGHVHKGVAFQAACGSWVLTNPALVPPDSFANSLGVMNGRSGQLLFESTKKRVVGDLRIIDVGPDEDNDASLEDLVKPWPGMELGLKLHP